MVNDDVLFSFRLRLFSLAAGARQRPGRLPDLRDPPARPTTAGGSRSCAVASRCSGRRERRPPRMPNQTQPAHRAADRRLQPGPSRARSAADQRDPRPGALGRHLGQPQRRLASRSAGTASTAGSARLSASSPGTLRHPSRSGRARSTCATSQVDHPGELVGFDCFHVGRLVGHDRPGLAVHRDQPRQPAMSRPSWRRRRKFKCGAAKPMGSSPVAWRPTWPARPLSGSSGS